MAQQFQVLRCCSCRLFQVQQVKKSKKWNCKVCNEKQSILKVFGEGSGSDCRRHVQKLNLLQGELQQAPMDMFRDLEEPIEMTDENTVNFKEELDQQEEKKEISSRWTKYLDKKSEEQEEEVLQREEECYSSKENMGKHTRKRKETDISDAQSPKKMNASGFTNDIKRFEENSRSFTLSTKWGGDATYKNVLTPDFEGHIVRKKNKEPCLGGAGLSKWDKFLFSGKSFTSGATTTLQKRQETLVKSSAITGKNEKAASSIRIGSHNWHCASQQNVAIPCKRVEEGNTTHHITLASIPVGRNNQPPSLASAHFQESLLNRLPGETTSTYSTSIVGISSSQTPLRSLFSTGDDFDDDI